MVSLNWKLSEDGIHCIISPIYIDKVGTLTEGCILNNGYNYNFTLGEKEDKSWMKLYFKRG